MRSAKGGRGYAYVRAPGSLEAKADRLLTASVYEKNSAPLLRVPRRILPVTCHFPL